MIGESRPALNFDASFGDAPAINWRDAPAIDDADDEEMKDTPKDVIAILGFDPAGRSGDHS